MKRRGIWLSVGAAVVLLGGLQGIAMAKKVLWSPMTGQVTLNGQPAAGATLVREADWHWKDEKITDKVVADAAGRFSFPSIERLGLLGSLLPHEPVIEQYMSIEYQGKKYDAWAFYKHNYNLNGENKGQPINVTCKLEAALALHGDVTSICEFH